MLVLILCYACTDGIRGQHSCADQRMSRCHPRVDKPHYG